MSQAGKKVCLRYNHYNHELTLGDDDALSVSEIKETFAFDYGFKVSAPSTNASTLVRPPAGGTASLSTVDGILAPARKMGRGAHGRG